MYNVLFHLNDEDTVEDTLNNIKNLFLDLESDEEEVKVQLVVHSKGVYPLKRNMNVYRNKILGLMKDGLSVTVCANTLEELNLEKEDLIEGITVVSSGVGEIVRKQKQGWIYIKP